MSRVLCSSLKEDFVRFRSPVVRVPCEVSGGFILRFSLNPAVFLLSDSLNPRFCSYCAVSLEIMVIQSCLAFGSKSSKLSRNCPISNCQVRFLLIIIKTQGSRLPLTDVIFDVIVSFFQYIYARQLLSLRLR